MLPALDSISVHGMLEKFQEKEAIPSTILFVRDTSAGIRFPRGKKKKKK